MNWEFDFKSIFAGFLILCISLGLSYETDGSQMEFMLRSGENAYWFLGFIIGVLPLAVIIVYNIIKDRKIERLKLNQLKGGRVK